MTQVPRSISFRALRKASYVVREMSRYYFPLYDIGAGDVLTYATKLLHCESLVFEVDDDLENGERKGLAARVEQKRRLVADLLAEDGLYDAAVARELANLATYAHLEARIVCGQAFDRGDLEHACALRTSDLRMLHRVLACMLGVTREDYFALLWPLEAIMDLELDLEDYHRDLARGSFNTLVMLQRLHGAAGGVAALQALFDRYETAFIERLRKTDTITQRRFAALAEAYQVDHPRPAIPTAPHPADCDAETRLL